MKVGDCVVVTEGVWVLGRVVQRNGGRYEVESASWSELRQWVDEERVRPVGWLLKLGQAARVLALTVRWALGDDLGYRAFCDALGMVIRTGLEGVANE